MEGLIGIAFNDFVLLAADKINAQSIIVVKNDQNKMYRLSDHLLMSVSGEPGDTVQFAEFIEKNIQLYKMRNGFELSPSSSATFIQRNLADYLRSRTPYMVNLLLAGFDTHTNKAELYYMDYLATMAKVPFGFHGYGTFFATSVLDRYYKPDCTVEEAVQLLRTSIAEIQKRLVINLPAFRVNIVDKDGIRELEDIIIDAKSIGLDPNDTRFRAIPAATPSVPMTI